MRRTIIGISNLVPTVAKQDFVHTVKAIGLYPKICKSLADAAKFITSKTVIVEIILLNYDEIAITSGQRNTNIYDILNTISTLCCIENKPTPPVMVSSTTKLPASEIRKLLHAGVKGITFVTTEFSDEDKQQSMLEVIAGKTYLHKTVQDVLKPRKIEVRKDKNNPIQLTQRQHQVLELICTRGASNKSIARLLDISESTVKLHTGAILKKYGLTNRTQLALFANAKKPKVQS